MRRRNIIGLALGGLVSAVLPFCALAQVPPGAGIVIYNPPGSSGAGATFTGPVVVSGASFGLSGNQSASGIFGTSGVRYKNVAGTLNDTTSSGTVGTNYDSVFGGNTLTATNATTITNSFGSYFKLTVISTNVTATNNYALGADNLDIISPNNTVGLTISGGSVTGSNTTPMIDLTGTLNTSAAVPCVICLNETVTGAGATSYLMQFFGGASGTTPEFSVATSGSISTAGSITLGSANNFTWGSHIVLSSPAAGQLQCGAADAASPVACTFSMQSVVTGTSNGPGANAVFDVSRSTGNNLSGNYTINIAPHGGSGTTQNTYVAGWSLNGDTGALTWGTTLYTSCTTLTTNGSAVVGCTASDAREKNDLGILVAATPDMPALHRFTFKHYKTWVLGYTQGDVKVPSHWQDNSYGPDGIHYGWFAQDVQKMYPELVHRGPKTPAAPDGELRFDKNELIVLLAAKQEAANDNFERRLAALEKLHAR